MLVPAFLAAIAAAPAVSAQYYALPPQISSAPVSSSSSAPAEVTSSATRCTTIFGYYPIPTGTAGTEALPTWYRFTTKTNIFKATTTTRDTITVTPTATTLVDVVTSATTLYTTETSTPAAVTIAPSAGFIPLLAVDFVQPTGGLSRAKRFELEARDPNVLRRQLQMPGGNVTGGYRVDTNGMGSAMYRNYTLRVQCLVSVDINRTETTVVTGLPETVQVAPATATAVSTVTVSVTETIEETAPTPSIWLACQRNNVVSSIRDFYGNKLVFDRITYSNVNGLPIENEMLVNTTSAENCCIACQKTPNCASSFFVPSLQECHMRLTQRPSAITIGSPAPFLNDTTNLLPTGTGVAQLVLPSTTAVPSAGTVALAAPVSHSNVTCSMGSMSQYVGTIQGTTDFPEQYALSFSNGPCGRMSVWPIPVDETENDPQRKRI